MQITGIPSNNHVAINSSNAVSVVLIDPVMFGKLIKVFLQLLWSFLVVTGIFQSYNVDQNNGPLGKITIDKRSGYLYVGGNNILLQLYSNLTVISEIAVGPILDNSMCYPLPASCSYQRELTDNKIHILAINERREYILACGTANHGLCSAYSLSDIGAMNRTLNPNKATNNIAGSVSGSSYSNSYAFFGSDYGQLPYSDNRVLYVAMGTANQSLQYTPAMISSREVKYSSNPWNMDYFLNSTTSYMNVNPSLQYKFQSFYIYGFENSGSTYFISVQMNDPTAFEVENNKFVTKIIKICQGDTDYSSYTELPIECTHGDKIYHIATSATFSDYGYLPFEKYLYVTFGKQDELNPSSDRILGSVLCTFDSNRITVMFEQLQKDCFACGLGNEVAWFVGKNLTEARECVRDTEQHLSNFCGGKQNLHGIQESTNLAVRGRQTLKHSAIYHEANSILSTVNVIKQNRKNIAVLGTDKGYLMKVTKFPLDACEVHTTCEQCVGVDPLCCGWCGNKCTSQQNCSSGWSGQSCPPIITKISPISGPTNGGTLLTLEGQNLGTAFAEVREITIGTDVCQVTTTITSTKITCTTQKMTVECEGQVKVIVNDSNNTPYQINGEYTSPDLMFSYKSPEVYDFTPKYGPLSGGTKLVVSGKNLNVGAQHSVQVAGQKCVIEPSGRIQGTSLTCLTPKLLYNKRRRKQETNSPSPVYDVSIRLDIYGFTYQFNKSYQFFEDSTVTSIDPHKSIQAYGISSLFPVISLTGTHLQIISEPKIIAILVINGTNKQSVPVGEYLNYGVTTKDMTVTIGNSVCEVTVMKTTVLYCTPKDKPSSIGDNEPKRTVEVGTDVEQRMSEELPNGAESRSPILLDGDILLVLKDKNLLIEREWLTLGEIVGKGNFGCVYRGYLEVPNVKRSQLVAVKTLHQDDPRQLDVDNFIEEALRMKDFHNPNVLTLTGICFGMDDMPLVILPFMAHGDLLSYIRKEENNPTIKDLILLGIDIARGMEYLSWCKFVHRDLATRNCMLDENFRAVVGDFGLSRDIYAKDYYASDNKKTKLPVKWMAPECLEKGHYSSQSDVLIRPIIFHWSFGVVLWELMTRRYHPYPDVDNWDVLRYIKKGRRMPQPPFCPDILYKMMSKCWSFNPNDRPKFSELGHEMINVLEQQMKQGQHTADIQSTYVNAETCTDYHYHDNRHPAEETEAMT
ncbi:hepatocyte growth factor receptor-like [Mytilus californianus]|uniref:hepatocyte growth factor receptor-like n=1 Tax=Mytilus californianus TaxID=6549 RepID=UPI0022461A81|nr:hepatocyte growth factor receptor-like [Mytilus californianus]